MSKSKVKAVALRQKDDDGGNDDKSCADKSFDFWWACVRSGADIDTCTRLSGVIEGICESPTLPNPSFAIR